MSLLLIRFCRWFLLLLVRCTKRTHLTDRLPCNVVQFCWNTLPRASTLVFLFPFTFRFPFGVNGHYNNYHGTLFFLCVLTNLRVWVRACIFYVWSLQATQSQPIKMPNNWVRKNRFSTHKFLYRLGAWVSVCLCVCLHCESFLFTHIHIYTSNSNISLQIVKP